MQFQYDSYQVRVWIGILYTKVFYRELRLLLIMRLKMQKTNRKKERKAERKKEDRAKPHQLTEAILDY